MDEVKVSVIVPVYNAETYIKECVDNLLLQTYKNIEIILVDDGSTDNSGVICDNYALRDSRVRVFRIPNSGPACARNYGLGKVTGEFIMFVDSDDWIEIETIENCIKALQKYDVDMVLFDLCNYDDRIIEYYHLFQENEKIFADDEISRLEDVMLTTKGEGTTYTVALGGPVCKLYKYELLEKCKFPEDIYFGEDTCYVAHALKMMKRVIYLKKTMYHRRIVETSLQHSKSVTQVERRRDFVNWILQFYKEKKEPEVLNEFIFHHYFMVLRLLGESQELKIVDAVKIAKKFLIEINYPYNFKEITLHNKNKKLRVMQEVIKRNYLFIFMLIWKIKR